MAIKKQAKNINITVINDYKLFVGNKFEKKAEQVNIEATDENLILASGKKITSKGNHE